MINEKELYFICCKNNRLAFISFNFGETKLLLSCSKITFFDIFEGPDCLQSILNYVRRRRPDANLYINRLKFAPLNHTCLQNLCNCDELPTVDRQTDYVFILNIESEAHKYRISNI